MERPKGGFAIFAGALPFICLPGAMILGLYQPAVSPITVSRIDIRLYLSIGLPAIYYCCSRAGFS